MGPIQKIFYLHLPSAFSSFLALGGLLLRKSAVRIFAPGQVGLAGCFRRGSGSGIHFRRAGYWADMGTPGVGESGGPGMRV